MANEKFLNFRQIKGFGKRAGVELGWAGTTNGYRWMGIRVEPRNKRNTRKEKEPDRVNAGMQGERTAEVFMAQVPFMSFVVLRDEPVAYVQSTPSHDFERG